MNQIGYVTIEEADHYVHTRYLSTDSLRVGWDQLTDESKAILLQRSMDSLEEMPFVGKKTCTGQPYAFPRYPEQEVPENVKRAQIEDALSLSDESVQEDAATYDHLWKFGVNSYSIGNLTETSADGSWGHARAGNAAGLSSTKAATLLAPYLQGGYNFE